MFAGRWGLVRSFLSWGTLCAVGSMLSCSALLAKSDRNHRCYKIISEAEDKTKVEGSPYVLCMRSLDLKKYPRSVVTFSLYEKDEKGNLRCPVNDDPVRLLVRIHYKKLSEDKFGLRSSSTAPGVEFDKQHEKVFVRFWGASGGKYHYKYLGVMKESSHRELAGKSR